MREALLRLYVSLQIVRDDRGQDLVEYALVIGLIALGATAGMNTLAGTIGSAFAAVGTKLGSYTS